MIAVITAMPTRSQTNGLPLAAEAAVTEAGSAAGAAGVAAVSFAGRSLRLRLLLRCLRFFFPALVFLCAAVASSSSTTEVVPVVVVDGEFEGEREDDGEDDG